MATPPSPDTVTLFRLIGDGAWHDYDQVRDEIARTIPPGRALRKYEERVEYKRKATGDPGYDTRASEDERQMLGAKACAQIVITSWKGRGVMHRFFKGRKQIAVRPGFTSWGLEAKGVLTPTPEDSEPSEAVPSTQDEPSEPEAVTPQPVPELTAADASQGEELGRQVGDALRGVHQSHGELDIDQQTGEGTCQSCRAVVIPSGFPGMVTDAGWDPCREPESAPPVDEAPTVEIATPALTIISEPEMDFLFRTSHAVGDASVRDAIARAELYFPKEPMTELTLRGDPDLSPRDETIYALIGQRSPEVVELTPEQDSTVDAAVNKEIVPEPEAALSEPVERVEPVAPKHSFMERLGLHPLPPEIVQRADELWAEMTADDPEEPSQPVTEEPVVTPCADEPQNGVSLPEVEQAPQDAEMALFRESEIRHLVQEEVSKAIDAFQLGMEQYLAAQFEQLSVQIGQLRASRGKWVFHPLKD